MPDFAVPCRSQGEGHTASSNREARHDHRADRYRSEKLPKPRISMRPRLARHAAICSSITFTASSTSRSTSWDCLCATCWISSDLVIGPVGAATSFRQNGGSLLGVSFHLFSQPTDVCQQYEIITPSLYRSSPISNVTVRNIDDDVIACIKAQAKANHRSLEGEIRHLLAQQVLRRTPA